MALSSIDKNRLKTIRRNMVRRCYEYDNDYKTRGITVCDDWKYPNDGIYKFWDWAEQNGYAPGLSIDRIDNNKGYCPENCRWVTPAAQQRNRRDNIKKDGLVLIDYLKTIGRENDYNTIRYRISTMHWSIDEAINIPIKKKINIKGGVNGKRE